MPLKYYMNKFKVGHKVVYRKSIGFSDVLIIITQKKWIELSEKNKFRENGRKLIKEIKDNSEKLYKCKPAFLIKENEPQYPTWMPENKLISYGRAFKVLYG